MFKKDLRRATITIAKEDTLLWYEETPIIYQPQSEGLSCLSACLAMMLNILEEDVVKDFHDRYRNHQITAKGYLEELEVPFQVIDSEQVELNECGVYLLTVPSLNIPQGLHAVILQRIGDYCMLFDPNYGVAGRKVYSLHEEDSLLDNEVRLNGFIPKLRLSNMLVNTLYA